MKKLAKAVRGLKQLIFLDLEGTQFSHELIAIGAIKATLNANGTIKKLFPGFKQYVLPTQDIGNYVEKLTGITDDMLTKDGISYDKVLPMLKKYIGSHLSKTKFVTFGNHDLRILRQSLVHTPEADHTFVKTIQKNHIDLSACISEYIKDDKNNTLSLLNLCKLFAVDPIEPAHDPLNDALMLAYLYSEFYKQTDIIVDRYSEVLLNMNNVPRPIKKILNKLKAGESVSYDDFYQYLREEIV
ncbi:MAG: exonuclease domain-containing protein [Bacilli bacterium]|jgi:DNA polymerase III epsilon subunit-like protein